VAPNREKDARRTAKRWVVVDDQDLCSALPVGGVVRGHLPSIRASHGAPQWG
jgi:hypothetical protein